DITVEYNGVKSKTLDTRVVDFSALNNGHGYSIDTGNGALNLDYKDERLLVRLGEADLQIGSYVFVHGAFPFEKVADLTNVALTPGGAMQNFSAVNIGAEGVTMFFGVDGPYWNDINHNNIVDSGETNPTAVGLAINNAKVALALLSPKSLTDQTRYIGLKASSSLVGFVGTNAFQLQASSINVELNIATKSGATQPLPVVTFSLFNNGAGYSIDTGSGTEVIDFDSRLIRASADDVIVNVSGFVYLT